MLYLLQGATSARRIALDMAPRPASRAVNAGEDDPIIDTTATLSLRSKRTERQQKKAQAKTHRKAASKQTATLWDLPPEIFLVILRFLQPSDIILLSHTSGSLRSFVQHNDNRIARTQVATRYAALAQCFPRAVLLQDVDEAAHAALRERPKTIHDADYHHIAAPDPDVVCTCYACRTAWNNLNIMVDFAHFQSDLDEGRQLPTIGRGKKPKWNRQLLCANGSLVLQALRSHLWYARILEMHLKSIIASIIRNSSNQGNRRRRFKMETEDVAAETDLFLERNGPPTIEPPYRRDNYYMLEAYLPNRGWISEESRWAYFPNNLHMRDVEVITEAWERRRRIAAEQAEESKGDAQ